MFSKACEYGIKATIYIAQQSLNNMRPNLKDISKEIDSPLAFTAKILQLLVKGNVIQSVKGASGGFEVNIKKMGKVKLKDIVKAIDKDFDYKICVLGLKICSEVRPCPVHYKYKHIKAELKTMLQSTNLLDLSDGLKDGKTCLRF
ncbi:MAG: Rrf2 family transcriptional regulator [Bacteroidota bacterium]